MSEPSAAMPPPATPPRSEAASTQALIAQIAAEARSTGKSITYDPEAPPDADGDDAPPAPAKGKAKGKTALAEGEDSTDESESDHEADEAIEAGEDEDGEGQDDAEEGAEGEPGEVDVDAVKAALAAEGGVDLLALAKALGKQVEDLGLSKGQSAFLRLERKRAQDTLKKAEDLSVQLRRDFGDQVEARKAASQGELEPAIHFIEATFGMTWTELNKAVTGLLEGKPVKDLEKNRELLALRKKEAEREAAEKARAEEAAQAKKVDDAKLWIRQQIKGDKLASKELDEQLRAAGFPSVVDLVFEEMSQNYSKGLTDPKKALEKVRGKLVKQAKALRTAGLVPKAKPTPQKPISASKPREGAQTGAAGNGRPMTDAELRQAVLKEAGLWR